MMGADQPVKAQSEETLPVVVGDALPEALSREGVATTMSWSRRVRGRVGLLLSVIVVFVLLGGVIGYLAVRPVYRAVGVIQVMPALAGSSGSGEPAVASGSVFDALVERQMARLGSQQVLLVAAESPGWGMLGRPAGISGATMLREAMEVSRVPQTRSQVRVSVNDRDPEAAVVGVRALLDAYQHTAEVAASDPLSDVDSAGVEEKRREAERALAKSQEELTAALREASPVPLDQVYAAKLTELNTLDVLIREAQAEVDAAAGAKAGRAMPSREETLAQLARTDSVLGGLLIRRQEILQQLSEYSKRMGDRSPVMIQLRSELTQIESQVDRRLDAPRQQAAAAGAGGLPGIDAGGQPDPKQSLAEKLVRLKAMRQKTAADTGKLADQLAKVQAVQQRVASHERQIEQAVLLLAQLRGGRQPGERINIVDHADGGAVVYQNPRRRGAATGALAGLAVGFLAAGAVAMTDRKLRHPVEAGAMDADVPLLGAVPTIDPNATDPRRLDMTALSIHEVRVLLQARAKADGSRTFAITSPSAGSGKTSLTVGLASSLALSGVKTLLVDCELASRVLDPRGSTGTQGKSSPGTPERQSLDQVMLDMGYLSRTDAEVFLYPADAKVGLLGMLDGLPLHHCAVETNIPGLSILPALSTQATHIGRMSNAFIRRLIDEAKGQYDMILFDTGPIPGSVEALFVAGEVDGVVLVTSHGEMQSRFDRSIAYLRLVGAKVVGTVFNRADEKDLTLHASAVTLGMQDAQASPDAGARRLPMGARNMGSGILAAAVQFQAKTPAATEDLPGAANPGHSPRPMGSPHEEISLKDTGDITDILMDDDKPAAENRGEKGRLDPVITAELDKLKKPGVTPKAD